MTKLLHSGNISSLDKTSALWQNLVVMKTLMRKRNVEACPHSSVRKYSFRPVNIDVSRDLYVAEGRAFVSRNFLEAPSKNERSWRSNHTSKKPQTALLLRPIPPESSMEINPCQIPNFLFPFGMSSQDLFKQFEKVTSIDDSATILTSLKRHQTDLALERGTLTTKTEKTQQLLKTGKTKLTQSYTPTLTATVETNVAVANTDTVATANVDVVDTDTAVDTTELISSFQIPTREYDPPSLLSDPISKDYDQDLKDPIDHLDILGGSNVPGEGILAVGDSPVEEERSLGFVVDRISPVGNVDPGLDGRTPGDFPGELEVEVPVCDAANTKQIDL